MQHEAPVLLAGNRSDIDLMAELIRQLPPWVHGQVLVEVRELAHIEELEVPAGLAVHWLVRESAQSPTPQPGARLIDAVTAWVAEWVPAEGSDDPGPELIWVGGSDWPELSMGMSADLEQAIAHGATLLQVDGNFDHCLDVARKLAESYPVELVNSVNPARIEGQKTASFEIVDALGDAPDIHCLPVGNAGNITAYWRGYREYAAPFTTADGRELAAVATKTPAMWGFQAEGAAPLVAGHPFDEPETIATAIRIGNPASWKQAEQARDDSGGVIDAVSDDEILAAHRILSSEEGIFVEPASAASIAGLLKMSDAGRVPAGATIVCTVTGHGLKDPQWALRGADGDDIQPERVSADAYSVARALGLDA